MMSRMSTTSIFGGTVFGTAQNNSIWGTVTYTTEDDNSEKHVRGRLGSMLQGGRWTDCEFLVGTELKEREVVKGHKNILAAASPVFEAMFYGKMAESRAPIPIPDIQPATFKTMLEYIYTDNIKVASLEEAFDLYRAAHKYILTNLEKICITIRSMLTKQNVWQVCEFALMFEEKSLIDKCADFINGDLKDVFTYLVSSKITLKNIKLGTLKDTAVDNGDSNAENSRMRRKESLEQDDQGTSPSPTGSKEKPNIHALLKKINFLTLSPEDFAEGPAVSGLLTESEAHAILMNIITKKSKIPMPSGFSTVTLTPYFSGSQSASCGWRYGHGKQCKCGKS